MAPQHRSILEGQLQVHSLWDWGHGDSIVGNFIKQRKSGDLHQAHQKIARLMIQKHYALAMAAKTIIYPTQNEKKPDHASSLARAVADQLQIPVMAIQLEKNINYKKQGQKQRFLARRALLLGPAKVEWPVLLVDDVVTTGATAQAVRHALNHLGSLSALVMAYKLPFWGRQRD